MPDELALVVDRPTPRDAYVLDLVARSAGLRGVTVGREVVGDRPHLAYGGAGPAGPRGVWIANDPGSPFWTDLLAGRIDASRHGSRIEFDLVHAIGQFVTDTLHADAAPDDRDEHGRLRFDASAPARARWGHLPVVDTYLTFIASLIRLVTGLTGLPRWPDGRRACIGLSHDVDEPDRYALLRSAARPWRLRRAPRTLGAEVVRLARRRLSDDDPDAFWAFPTLIETEARHGFRSTFFFAATPFHAAAGGLPDVHYDVRGGRYRREIARLVGEGFGVGLHAGYRAYEAPERFVAERRRIEEVAGQPITGVRHHYWHLGPDVAATLRAHEHAGFGYDSSLAFNEHLGFRRGIGLPYRPFDEAAGRPLRTWQLPPFCMDGNLFYASDDVEAAVRAVSEYVDVIRDLGTFGAIDWHIQAAIPRSVEFRSWGVAYQEILDMLAARSDVWVTSLELVHAWVADRDRRLTSEAAA